MNNHHNEEAVLAILDAGSQFGKVIDRRLRELQIKTAFLPLNTSPEYLRQINAKGLIISGGPGSVLDEDPLEFNEQVFNIGVPIFGICYGMQLVVSHFGGKVEKTAMREDGQYEVTVDPSCGIFAGLSKKQTVLLTHGDTCTDVGRQLKNVGNCDEVITAVSLDSKRIYGVQFHPEVDLTPQGTPMMKNFVGLCGIKPSFTLKSRLEESIDSLRKSIGNKEVVCFASGGVDSSVCAAMLHKAIGRDKVFAVHINNGFLRQNESKETEKRLADVGCKIQIYDEATSFSVATTRIPIKSSSEVLYRPSMQLNRTVDPEEKRRIIGDHFISIYSKILRERNLNPDNILLAQGTLRPDLIESGSHYASKNADAIKTHHNDTELVRQMRKEGKVIEPLKDFHKDEVRQIGAELRLSNHILHRHPFPGPGLAIRILCADQPFMESSFCETQTVLKHIVTYHSSKSRPYHLFNKILSSLSKSELEMLDTVTKSHKYTATLLPIRTVGVQGDARSYSYCAAFSMAGSGPNQAQAHTTPPKWEHLFFFARIVPRCCHNINRVTFVFGPEVKYHVNEITPTYLEKPVVDLLRQADDAATKTLVDEKCVNKLSQMPVVMIPVHFDRDPMKRIPSTKRSVVLRTFLSNDFMTGKPAYPGKDIPEAVLGKIRNQISSIPGISRVLYDLTSKPPGTTEWE